MTAPVILTLEDSRAEIIPSEGGVLSKYWAEGKSILAATPWSDNIAPSGLIAPDEKTWVSQWRGGWQLCAPNTGSAGEGTKQAAFHGAASQASWKIISATANRLKLYWMDSEGEIELVREWSIDAPGSVSVETFATNHSLDPKPVGFAEHLILGSEFLEPVKKGAQVLLDLGAKASIVELDYAGAPTGNLFEELASTSSFTQLTSKQPAKVFAVASPQRKSITVNVADWVAKVEWRGLDHALVWQEFGTSREHPWNGEVFALGIEPTNVAHGLGANDFDGPFLQPGETISWQTSLHISRKVNH